MYPASSIFGRYAAPRRATGSGPYTCTLNAALVNTHYASERLSQGNERNRRYRNNFLRNLPDAVAGVFDFEKLMERTPGAFDCDPRYACSDRLHFYRGAQIEKARAPWSVRAYNRCSAESHIQLSGDLINDRVTLLCFGDSGLGSSEFSTSSGDF